MGRAQGIRGRGHRKKLQVSDLDITSLLDICTILLVFLVQSYDTSQVQVSVQNEITLPTSKSRSMNNQAVLVQVSPTKIWVDRKLVLDTTNMPENFLDDDNRRIIPLFDELTKMKEMIQKTSKEVPNAQPFNGFVNLVVDKSIKYSYLKKLMYTTAQAGYREYKFVVRSEEN